MGENDFITMISILVLMAGEIEGQFDSHRVRINPLAISSISPNTEVDIPAQSAIEMITGSVFYSTIPVARFELFIPATTIIC